MPDVLVVRMIVHNDESNISMKYKILGINMKLIGNERFVVGFLLLNWSRLDGMKLI